MGDMHACWCSIKQGHSHIGRSVPFLMESVRRWASLPSSFWLSGRSCPGIYCRVGDLAFSTHIYLCDAFRARLSWSVASCLAVVCAVSLYDNYTIRASSGQVSYWSALTPPDGKGIFNRNTPYIATCSDTVSLTWYGVLLPSLAVH